MKSLLKTLSLGVAAGAISLCSLSSAQAQTEGTTTMTTVSSSSMMPMPVSGTVLRYYVNRAGYVTAMDVQAADGVKLVRFSPSMAQNLTSQYPVGSTASVFVTGTPMGAMTRYDLAGVGTEMPAPGSMMSPMMISDLDILKAEPFTTIGAQSMTYAGKLTGFIADPMDGDVLAIILDNSTLVRVPRENRLRPASMGAGDTVALTQGADVVVQGLPEAPRYGVVSPFANRIIATGIAVNGRNLGAFGFGSQKKMRAGTLLGFNVPLPGAKMSTDESMAMNMGYSTYSSTPSTPMSNDNMSSSGTAGGMGTMGGTGTAGGTMAPTPGM